MPRHIIQLTMVVLLGMCLVLAGCGSEGGSGGAAEGQSSSSGGESSASTGGSAASNNANADTTPNYVNFSAAIASQGVTVVSATPTVTGINVPVDFVVTSITKEHYFPKYRINGGAWKNIVIGQKVQVQEGDTIQLRVTTPITPSFDTIQFNIKVGTFVANWQVAFG